MKVENKFIVESPGNDKLVLIQQVIKEMDAEEALVEYNKLLQEHVTVKDNLAKMQKYIDDGEAEEQLAELKENDELLISLTSSWDEKLQPLLVGVKKKVKKMIREQKVKRGYDREKNGDKKLVLRANILGHVSNECNLEVTHPIIKEFRKDFDKV